MFHFDRRKALSTTVLAALLAGCAVPLRPADSIDAVHATNQAAPAVDIDVTQDAQHRVIVRYRAPETVTHLDFLQAYERADKEVRVPLMKPMNDCGALVPGGIALRQGAGCEQGAAFAVAPRTLGLYAMNELAQPTGDGGVLLFTGYYAAAAPGLEIRWHFTPTAGDYGIDEGRRHDAPWQVATHTRYDRAGDGRDPRDDGDFIRAQHASHYVFMGHTPMSQSGDLLWVRDPALSPVITQAIGRAAPIAWDAYVRATGRQPDGPTAIVMLAAPDAERASFHGDTTEGRMMRLSFTQSAQTPTADQLAELGRFVAHETAHWWNHGVYLSDQARPWLHEGDAEWVAINVLHDAGLVSDAYLMDHVQAHVDNCLQRRGEHAAATIAPGWAGEDDPYGCGVALQLLGFARVHAAHPEATPLSVWAALHRAHPMLDAAGFAQFFDADAAPMLGPLILDDKVPFASTYRADLASYLPPHESAGEPALGSPRRNVAVALMAAIARADCGGDTPFGAQVKGNGEGEFPIESSARCKALPAGARVTTLAGTPALLQPRAAWRAVLRSCASGGSVDVGFSNHAAVHAACPTPMPPLPPLVMLPEDTLQRLGLKKNAS